jgi:hypothetical protein
MIKHYGRSFDEVNAILADPEQVKTLGSYPSPILGTPKTLPATPAATTDGD